MAGRHPQLLLKDADQVLEGPPAPPACRDRSVCLLATFHLLSSTQSQKAEARQLEFQHADTGIHMASRCLNQQVQDQGV
jgi:hypothetical protein